MLINKPNHTAITENCPRCEKIADEFRYSNPISLEKAVEIEEDMKSQLGDLQQVLVEGNSDGAKSLCGKLMGRLMEWNRIRSIEK